MMFNGAFLGVDKLAVICLTIAIYEAIRRQGAENRLDEITRNRSEQKAFQRKAEEELDGVRAAVGG